jgi:hypothetical protein
VLARASETGCGGGISDVYIREIRLEIPKAGSRTAA